MIAATPKYIWRRVAVLDDLAIHGAADRECLRIGDLVGRDEDGPIGQNVSSDLPRTHWPSPNWMSRADTSLRQV